MEHDVIFVHGINSRCGYDALSDDVFATWDPRDWPSTIRSMPVVRNTAAHAGLWPILRGIESPPDEASVYCFTYYGRNADSASQQLFGGPTRSVATYAKLLHRLVRVLNQAGKKPIIVCHSLGGLVVRYMLHNEMNHDLSSLHRVIIVGSPQGGIAGLDSWPLSGISNLSAPLSLLERYAGLVFPDAKGLFDSDIRKLMGPPPTLPQEFLRRCTPVDQVKVGFIAHPFNDFLVPPTSSPVAGAPGVWVDAQGPGAANHAAMLRYVSRSLDAMLGNDLVRVKGTIRIAGSKSNKTVWFGHVALDKHGGAISRLRKDRKHDEYRRWSTRTSAWLKWVNTDVDLFLPSAARRLRLGIAARTDGGPVSPWAEFPLAKMMSGTAVEVDLDKKTQIELTVTTGTWDAPP